MTSIFSRIVAGEIPCHKVWEDADHLAFLDINPVVAGHTLVIPKREVGYLFDMGEEEYAALWAAARRVSLRLKEVLGCKRVCVSVVGYEVPHTHIHLVPTKSSREFPPPAGRPASHQELAAIAARLAG